MLPFATQRYGCFLLGRKFEHPFVISFILQILIAHIGWKSLFIFAKSIRNENLLFVVYIFVYVYNFVNNLIGSVSNFKTRNSKLTDLLRFVSVLYI